MRRTHMTSNREAMSKLARLEIVAALVLMHLAAASAADYRLSLDEGGSVEVICISNKS